MKQGRLFYKLRPQDRELIQERAVIIWQGSGKPEKPFEETVTGVSPVSGELLQVACRFTNRGVEEASTRYPIRNCTRVKIA